MSIDISKPTQSLRDEAKQFRRDAKTARDDAAHHEGIAVSLRKRADEDDFLAGAYDRAADQLDGVLVVPTHFNHVHVPDGQGGVKVVDTRTQTANQHLAETVEGSSAPPKRGPGRPRRVEK